MNYNCVLIVVGFVFIFGRKWQLIFIFGFGFGSKWSFVYGNGSVFGRKRKTWFRSVSNLQRSRSFILVPINIPIGCQ